MTDFDAALERLISDPSFRDALAADPGRALAGYRLSDDELSLLESQVDSGTGGERHVEQRTSKASLFGLLSPMGGMGSLHSGVTETPSGSGAGLSDGHSQASFGADAGRSGASFGADSHSQASFGVESADPGRSGASFGADDPDGYRARHSGDGLGSVMGSAGDFMSDGGENEAPGPVYDDHGDLYQTRVDANGDGRWDQFTTTDRGGQGVELAVDRDGDGRVDWVGHDFDRDGLIDEASVDHDNDGVLETRWVDNDGDGWMDAQRPMQASDAPASGTSVAGGPDGAGDGTEAQRGWIEQRPSDVEARYGHIESGPDRA